MLAGQTWPVQPVQPVSRRANAAIDTAPLSAGITLWALRSLHPVSQPWLGTKLLLRMVYIVPGWLALKRAPRPRQGAASAKRQ